MSLGRFFAHHEGAQRGMADHRRDVDRRAARFEGVEIFGEGLEPPVLTKPRLERCDGHAFDVF